LTKLGRAGKVLGDGERDKSNHSEASVPELGVGGHDPAAPALGALPLEHRRQRRGGEDDGGVREPREPRAVAGLREEAVAAGGLDGERGHEAHHGQPPVDPLRRGPAERQRVPASRANWVMASCGFPWDGPSTLASLLCSPRTQVQQV